LILLAKENNMNLVLIRHGESTWNIENKFTGWTDVGLTEVGIEEAIFASKKLVALNLEVNSVYTSLLKRAIDSTKIICNNIKFPSSKINYEWRLNERHYGALEGLNKSETALKYGEEQVDIWRRSYDIRPPLLSKKNHNHPIHNEKFNFIKKQNLPDGESLKDVIFRLQPFWNKYFEEIKLKRGNNVIIAHSNSLRAIIKIIEKLTKDEIKKINIPTGVPLVYNFDAENRLVKKEYLINKNELKRKQAIIINQGKVK
jgi:2,3-bisphosphoglycerate-dependent phosphoglycerate mutase